MKNKFINVVFKKIQSYSFIIFLLLVVAAFIALTQLNNHPNNSNVPADNQNQNTGNNGDNSTVVTAEDEIFKLPLNVESPTVIRDFYSVSASQDDQIKAIIQVDNSFFTNQGVNYQNNDGTVFDVVASLSGTVSKVTQDPLLGYVVKVDHINGVQTVYQSLASVKVAVGDKVAQGDVLGTAGENNFDKDSGIHVHFEVLENGQRINPNDMIGTQISDLSEKQ